MDAMTLQKIVIREETLYKLNLLFKALQQGLNFFNYTFIALDGFPEFKKDFAQEEFLPGFIEPNYLENDTITYKWASYKVDLVTKAAIKLTREILYIKHPKIVAIDTQERLQWKKIPRKKIKKSPAGVWQDILIKNSCDYLPGLELLYNFDRLTDSTGLGDNLIFTDGMGIFVIVVVKQTNGYKVTEKVKKATLKMEGYRTKFTQTHKSNSEVVCVIGMIFTDEDRGTVRFVNKKDKFVAKMVAKAAPILKIESIHSQLNFDLKDQLLEQKLENFNLQSQLQAKNNLLLEKNIQIKKHRMLLEKECLHRAGLKQQLQNILDDLKREQFEEAKFEFDEFD
ncbi:hypothetical protein G9A89_002298 [Geosiphon pyriformis]|nr:hypothetical protein G9A89_002298 [Geosiphon pyriformis]